MNAAAIEKAESPLAALLAQAADHKVSGSPYAGDVSPSQAYNYLLKQNGALVDVRTTPEWQFVGTPDLMEACGKFIALSWKLYPAFSINSDFASSLAKESGIAKDTPLFFMCRSGGRSLDAAQAMTAEGYRYCFNIAGGFEGDPDADGHRGANEGWKAAKLPWRQN